MGSEMAAVAEPGFGVYIHWPFCAQKCPYCDFNSHVRAGGPDEARFLAAYLRELSHVAGLTGPRTVTSIFLGGGTPSLMQPATVAGLLDHIARLWAIAPDAEITLEANPGSVESGRFQGYRLAGVNRVSVGVQSLDEAALAALGRIHSVSEARAAVRIAQATFARTSFDLIYARPGQSEAAWRAELAEALAMAGEHLSLYQLTIEPETAYARLHAAGKLAIPGGEAAQALYAATQELTEAAGLPSYEISNHARPGAEGRHNMLYWRYGEYAGVGAGAHGRLVVSGTRTATSAVRNPEGWLDQVEREGHGLESSAALSREQIADEMLLMGLRIAEGLDLARLAAIAGAIPSRAAIGHLTAIGMLAPATGGRRLIAAPEGRIVLDAVIAELAGSLTPAAD